MRITPSLMGAVTAILAVSAQAFLYFDSTPAYGFCVICHGRDLMIWLTSKFAALPNEEAQFSVYWPMLTVAGIFIGSRYAAKTCGEYRPTQGEKPWTAFFCGMAIMILGLIIMGCPARLLLRTAYGDVTGALGMGAIAVGVVAATILMRWRAAK